MPTTVAHADHTGDTAVAADSADGTWTVTTDPEPYDLAASTGSFVGYRIDEELANVGTTQAVGRGHRHRAREGEVVVVTGSLEVALADLTITAPSAAVVLSVADTATIEWQLSLTRA